MKSKITLEPEQLTKEQQIALLEQQLQNCKPRDAAAISRQLAILRGDLIPGVYQHSTTAVDQRKQAKRAEERAREEAAGKLPSWWSEKWARYYVYSRALSDSSSPSHWTQELDRCEAAWSASEGLTIEQLREQIRREYSEHMQQYFPNGYPRNTEEWMEWDKQHPSYRGNLLASAGICPDKIAV